MPLLPYSPLAQRARCLLDVARSLLTPRGQQFLLDPPGGQQQVPVLPTNSTASVDYQALHNLYIPPGPPYSTEGAFFMMVTCTSCSDAEPKIRGHWPWAPPSSDPPPTSRHSGERILLGQIMLLVPGHSNLYTAEEFWRRFFPPY